MSYGLESHLSWYDRCLEWKEDGRNRRARETRLKTSSAEYDGKRDFTRKVQLLPVKSKEQAP